MTVYYNYVKNAVVLTALFVFLASCEQPAAVDTSAPGEVDNLNAAGSSTQITLSYTEPSDPDFKGVLIYYGKTGSSEVLFAGTVDPSGTVFKGLENYSEYSFSIHTEDNKGNISKGLTVSTMPVISETFQIDDALIKMQYCPGGTYTIGGLDINNLPTPAKEETVEPFFIAETEVTWKLWRTVYIWATGDSDMNGIIEGNEIAGNYVFSNTGRQGGDKGSGPVGTEMHPVTTVSWRDAMIFCNALTEYSNAHHGTNLKFVYASDDTFTTPLRISTKNSVDSDEDGILDSVFIPGSEDAPFVDPLGDGFRLPLNEEWEYAARFHGSWTPPDFASGANVPHDTADDRTNVSTEDVAVFNMPEGSTAPVKSKKANALGIFDMSGNVFEVCFQWHGLYENDRRVLRGSGWSNASLFTQSALAVFTKPSTITNNIGFRITKSP